MPNGLIARLLSRRINNLTQAERNHVAARLILQDADVFRTGCGNTIGKHPADCPECTEHFVNRIRQHLR